MKKLVLVIFSIFLISGCGKKEEERELEHFDLSNKEVIYHEYYAPNQLEVYVVAADITPKGYESRIHGIFYKVSTHDYILIDKFDSQYQTEEIVKFYNDKAYIISQNILSGIFEYTLRKEQLQRKELEFTYNKTFSAITIEDIKDNYIYFNALSDDDGLHHIRVSLKCSLSTYQCELVE